MDFTLDTVKERLEQLGYTATTEDEGLINYIISKTIVETKKKLNVLEIDVDINYALIDMVCGEFLQTKKGLNPESFFIDFTSTIKSITEGDTKIDFAIGSGDLTNEQRLDILINTLLNAGNSIFNKFRCLSW